MQLTTKNGNFLTDIVQPIFKWISAAGTLSNPSKIIISINSVINDDWSLRDENYLDKIDKMLMAKPLEHANLPQCNLLDSRIILRLQKFLDRHNLEIAQYITFNLI